MSIKTLSRLIGFQTMAAVVLGLGSSTFSAAHAVEIGARDWRQLTETTEISWVQLATIYDTATGQLLDPGVSTLINGSGSVVDFAGWTWASLSDIGNMFTLAGAPACTDPCYTQETDSSWAPAFIDTGLTDTGLFEVTQSVANFRVVSGWSRTPHTQSDYAYIGAITDDVDVGQDDFRSTAAYVSKYTANTTQGVFLYKDSSNGVPSPAPILLVSFGLVGLRIGKWGKRGK